MAFHIECWYYCWYRAVPTATIPTKDDPMPLTHTGINKLQPSPTAIDTKRPDKHSDGNGLQLWVRYTGVMRG